MVAKHASFAKYFAKTPGDQKVKPVLWATLDADVRRFTQESLAYAGHEGYSQTKRQKQFIDWMNTRWANARPDANEPHDEVATVAAARVMHRYGWQATAWFKAAQKILGSWQDDAARAKVAPKMAEVLKSTPKMPSRSPPWIKGATEYTAGDLLRIRHAGGFLFAYVESISEDEGGSHPVIELYAQRATTR